MERQRICRISKLRVEMNILIAGGIRINKKMVKPYGCFGSRRAFSYNKNYAVKNDK